MCNTNSFGTFCSAEQALHHFNYHILFQNISNCLISKNNIIATKTKSSFIMIMNHIYYVVQECFNTNV